MRGSWSFTTHPKHGSWLNMAEIEFSVISRRCPGQRHPGEDSLCRGVHALEQERNEAQAIINWQFTTQDAKTKLHLFNVNYFCRLASIILAGSPPYPAPASATPKRSTPCGLVCPSRC